MGRWDNLLTLLSGACLVFFLFRLRNMTLGDEVASDEKHVENDDDAEPSFVPPTPTALTGPQALRPIVGRCAYGNQPGSHFRYEFCGYRSVRQHSGNDVFSMGHWKGKWITKEEGGKTVFVGQEYEGGTPCGGNVRRRTNVYFSCVPDVKTVPRVSDIEETAPCMYKMMVGVSQWCEVEKL